MYCRPIVFWINYEASRNITHKCFCFSIYESHLWIQESKQLYPYITCRLFMTDIEFGWVVLSCIYLFIYCCIPSLAPRAYLITVPCILSKLYPVTPLVRYSGEWLNCEDNQNMFTRLIHVNALINKSYEGKAWAF